jgi:hypothetical protein
MPWTPADAKSHKKGLSPAGEKKWAKIANSARAKCIADGGSEKVCDASAIRIANSQTKESKMPETLDEAILSYNDKRAVLSAAVQEKFGKPDDKWSHWVQDFWDEDLAYEDSNTHKYYKVPYSIDDAGTVTLGDPVEVILQSTYEPIGSPTEESKFLMAKEFIKLSEKPNADGVVRVKVIQPG